MKFGYWGIQGLGQPSRYIIAAGKLNVTEKEYTSQEEWFEKDKPEIAKKGFFPNLPYLEIKDGTLAMSQSRAILTFLGKMANYGPADDMEAVRIDVLYGVIDDLNQKFFGLMMSGDKYESTKAAKHADMLEIFKKLDGYYAKHKYSATNRDNGITWVDFFALHFFNVIRRFSGEFMKFENVNKFFENLLAELGDDFRKMFEENNAKRPFMPPGMGAWGSSGCAPNDMKAEF